MSIRIWNLKAIALAGFAAGMLATPSLAADTRAMVPPVITKDPAKAPAGNYNLDDRHTALVVRAHYLNYAFVSIRFDTVTGSLKWDPANVANSKVTIDIDPKSLSTPAPGFKDTLMGKDWFDVATYGTAKFVSTGIVRKDATHGTIEGNLTLKGITKKVTINAELLGAGTDTFGVNSLGLTGTAVINRQDFGLAALPKEMVGNDVQLVIDVVFRDAVPN